MTQIFDQGKMIPVTLVETKPCQILQLKTKEKDGYCAIQIGFDKFIKEKNQLLIKKLHPVKQTHEDLIKNIAKKDKVIINAIKEGIVIHGYEKIAQLIKNVSGKE